MKRHSNLTGRGIFRSCWARDTIIEADRGFRSGKMIRRLPRIAALKQAFAPTNLMSALIIIFQDLRSSFDGGIVTRSGWFSPSMESESFEIASSSEGVVWDRSLDKSVVVAKVPSAVPGWPDTKVARPVEMAAIGRLFTRSEPHRNFVFDVFPLLAIEHAI